MFRHQAATRSAADINDVEVDMPILLWLLGVPIPIILILLLLWH